MIKHTIVNVANAEPELSPEELTAVVGGMSCAQAEVMAAAYEGLGAVSDAMGDKITGLALASRGYGFRAGGCDR